MLNAALAREIPPTVLVERCEEKLTGGKDTFPLLLLQTKPQSSLPLVSFASCNGGCQISKVRVQGHNFPHVFQNVVYTQSV